MGRKVDHFGIRRAAAFLLDLLLISVLFTLMGNVFREAIQVKAWVWAGRHPGLSTFLYCGILALYFIGCDLLNGGDTLGKDILGLKTIGPGGEPLCLKYRLVRTLLKLIGIGMLPVSLLLFLWNGKGFTLQDYVVGSMVIEARKNGLVR